MNCIHCNFENKDNWFYCKSCGRRASEPTFTTNMFMRSERGKRSDVEISVKSMDDAVSSEIARRKQTWKDKVNAIR